MVGTPLGPMVGTEDKVRALDRVLQSETFSRSERLKSLLRFLCEAEIDGREGELTEYAIGTGALGRPRDFAPLEDSSVRSRAYELRQKLEKYYALEAPDAPIHIELRKGSYVPRFQAVPLGSLPAPPAEARPAAASEVRIAPLIPGEIPPSEVPGAPAARQPATVWIAVFAFAAGCAAMLAALVLWSLNVPPGTQLPATRLRTNGVDSLWSSELETLWRPMLDKGPLTVAFETRFFVQMGPLVVRDWDVNTMGEVESSKPLMQVRRLFGLGQLYASGNYTDVGAPEALFYLTRLLSDRVPLAVRNSREMTAAEFRDSNLIFVGKPWLDPQIDRVLSAAELVDRRGSVVNRHPRPGEQAVYADQQYKTDPEGWTEKYAVISMMPNPAGGKRVLALTASGSEHPSALAYYMTNRESARELVARLRATPGGMPMNYQVLVRSEFKGKALVKVEYVTHRALKF